MPERVLVAVAHGSADPRAAATIDNLIAAVAARAPERATARGLTVPHLRTAYLSHAAPSLAQVMDTIEGGAEVTVLPLLLTAAYHSKTDIPRALARLNRDRQRPQVRYGAPLGPHPLLLRALERRLAEADPGGSTPPTGPTGPTGPKAPTGPTAAQTGVVLAAAGSSDPDANAAIAHLAAQWRARAGWFAVRPAYASAADPAPAAAVTSLLKAGARRVVVATYLLAPGFFADRIRDSSHAAGAAAVAPPLGAAEEVAEVLLDRYHEAGSRRRTAA
jgi:sirohydrochlorin ferrochelatase